MDNNKEFDSAELTENSQEFDVMDTDKAYRKRRFKKKKHGANGFFHRIGDWWFGLSKAKKIWFSIGVGFLAVVLSLVIAVASIVIPLLMNFNHNDITSDPNELGFDEIIDERVVNIALFGIDTRNTSSFSGNSDSIIEVDIYNKKKRVCICQEDDTVKCLTFNKSYDYRK